MAKLDIPAGGLSLHGWPLQPTKSSTKDSTIQRSAILLKINRQTIRDLQQCSRKGEKVRLLTGRTPKLQYGSSSISFTVDPEKFTHEAYCTSTDIASGTLQFAAPVTQRATLTAPDKTQHDTGATDAALANLKQSLASFAQDKEAKQATISSTIIPNTKYNKVLPKSHALTAQKESSRAATPLHAGGLPVVASDPTAAAQNKAMVFALSHLLSSRPLTDDDIARQTHIPQPKRLELLHKVAEQDAGTKRWALRDRAYKELEIWKFKYPSEEDRECAIDNAIRAFDRTRLSKDDKLWQLLLPETERGKGKCLSRLHNNIHLASTIDKPHLLGKMSPLPAADADATTANPGRLTPLAGSTALARSSSAAGKPVSIEKRLKESQKLRAAEETKEHKKSHRDSKVTATPTLESSRTPTTKSVTKTGNRAYKSEAVVHSSDDDSDGEMDRRFTEHEWKNGLEGGLVSGSKPNYEGRHPTDLTPLQEAKRIRGLPPSKKPPGRPKVSPRHHREESSSSDEQPLQAKAAARGTKIAAIGSRNVSPKKIGNRTPIDHSNDTSPAAIGMKGSVRKDMLSKRIGKEAAATASGKTTPNHLSVNAGKSPLVHPTLNSGKNTPAHPSGFGKTKTPSPPGRPAGSTPSMFGSFQPKPQQLVRKAAPNGGGGSTKGHKASNSVSSVGRPAESKKRLASDVVDDSDRPLKAAKRSPLPDARTTKMVAPSQTNGRNAETTLKRKANNGASGMNDHDGGPIKHRRTESSSAQSVTYSSSSGNSHTTTARTSIASPSPPAHGGWLARSPSVTSSASEAGKSSWERALDDAERFRTILYPQYQALYDKLQSRKSDEVSREDTEKLWKLHQQLKVMKRQISTAANA